MNHLQRKNFDLDNTWRDELQIFCQLPRLGLGYLIHVREYISHLRLRSVSIMLFMKPPGFKIQCDWVFSVDDI